MGSNSCDQGANFQLAMYYEITTDGVEAKGPQLLNGIIQKFYNEFLTIDTFPYPIDPIQLIGKIS